MSFACQSYAIRMSILCTRMSSVCLYVLVCHLCSTRIYSYVIPVSLVCTRMLFICLSYLLLRHPYVTNIYSHVIRMSLVCTRMSSVCHSYVLVYHSYVTCMCSYVIRMSLVCGFTMNHSVTGKFNFLIFTETCDMLCFSGYTWINKSHKTFL